jgi:hypothetical protein
MSLQHVGTVSSEGGPLLVLDREALPAWGGIDYGDFERIGTWLDEHPGTPGYEAAVGAATGLVWDLGGAGTADVFRSAPDRLVLVRAWVTGDDEALVAEAAARPVTGGGTAAGGLTVGSGPVLVFWPVDRGPEIELPADAADGDPIALPSMDGAALAVTLPPGRYAAHHDEVAADGVRARRLVIAPPDP